MFCQITPPCREPPTCDSRLTPAFHLSSSCFWVGPLRWFLLCGSPFPAFSGGRIISSRGWIPGCWLGYPIGLYLSCRGLRSCWWWKEEPVGASVITLPLNLYLSSHLPPCYLQGWMREESSWPAVGCRLSSRPSLQLDRTSQSCLSSVSLASEPIATLSAPAPCLLTLWYGSSEESHGHEMCPLSS